MSAAAGGEWKSASWKQEEDFSKQTAEVLGRINSTEIPVLLRSTTRSLEDYLDEILGWEKKARFGGDVASSRKLAVEVIRIYRMLGKFDDMMTALDTLMRKRAQMKSVQSSLIAEASFALGDGAIYCETTAAPEGGEGEAKTDGPNVSSGSGSSGDASSGNNKQQEEYVKLLKSLQEQCEGKIHLELEHARFSSRLAKLSIKEGKKREASDMLANIQVETITNMPRLEKIQSVLTQLRLSLELNDDSRFIVLSRKLNPRALGKDDTRSLKCEYFMVLAKHYEKHSQWLPMSRCWYEIFQVLQQEEADKTAPVSDDAAATTTVSAASAASASSTTATASSLRSKASSLFLEFNSKEDGTQNVLPTLSLTGAISNTTLLALMAGHIKAKDLDDLQEFCAFAKSTHFENRIDLLKILQQERILQTEVESMAKLILVFLSQELIRVPSTPTVTDLGKHHPLLAEHEKRREALSARLSEHDLVVISKFYSQARIGRLAELVGLTPERTESFIMDLVDAGEMFARFDRVAGVVTFEESGKPSTLLKEWTSQVEQTASLVERAAQLISKERMVQASMTN